MNTKIYFVLIVLLCIILGISLGKYTKETSLHSFITKCYFDSDCSWEITNCCPENAGAFWECVNLKTFRAPRCPGRVICPQVISPKPTELCICKEGGCVG